MSIWLFLRRISWRPMASYFFMFLIFFVILKLYDVDKINIGGAIAVSLPLVVGLAWVYYRRVSKPLSEINRASREIAQGNFKRQINITSKDEIGDLARSINDMATRLRDTIEEITEERNRAQAILNSMADCVIAFDRQGRIILVNPAVEEIFGITQTECVGKKVLEVIRNCNLDDILKKVQIGDKPISREVKIISPEPRVFRLHATPLNGSSNGGAVVLLRDITERNNMEKMRSEFVANVSHELRTPLTSIHGFVETLLESGTDDPEMTRHFLEIIITETRRLSKLVNELMDLSKIEGRRVVHRWQQVEISRLVDRVLVVCGPHADGKLIKVKTDLPSNLSPLFGDPDMLAQVLINLIDNAIKYTPMGGIVTISAKKLGDEIRLSIEDTGMGIPAESLSRIFERFYRVEKARSRELGGIGLGLAIVKHIIKAHGGRVDVKSMVGEGTVFSVFLPLDNPAAVDK